MSPIHILCLAFYIPADLFSKLPPHPRSTLFPYTTLFRSINADPDGRGRRERTKRYFPCLSEKLRGEGARRTAKRDRKSTRLNSSHSSISYAVFCLKK